MSTKIPEPDGFISLQALRALRQKKTTLAALEVFRAGLGELFRINLPGFRPVMMSGPKANRFVLVEAHHDLLWRPEGDPVAKLLRHGLLVEDGASHDYLRHQIEPALHKKMLNGYIAAMVKYTDQSIQKWQSGSSVDMLVEMRRLTLLILMDTLYHVDFTPDLDRLWKPILKVLRYISPGLWLIWRGAPRFGYRRAIQEVDAYLYHIIRERRKNLGATADMLGGLIASGMDDDLIRDQLLTILIAGHDTSTALLAWVLYLLGQHPDVMQQVQTEVDTVLGNEVPQPDHLRRLVYLEQVIAETLRLFPPIHIGNRITLKNLTFQGYTIPANVRVVYSIYLAHRDPTHWQDADQFRPERFAPHQKHPAYTYLPFGGGKRNCVGAAYAQIEAKVVLARLLQQVSFTLLGKKIHAHMGATLEPRPGVLMQVWQRN